jgi:hypothetical protein
MKVKLVVTFDGITDFELRDALQALRDIEQKSPDRIMMFVQMDSPEMTRLQVVELFDRVHPPFDYMQYIELGRNAGPFRPNDPHRIARCTPESPCCERRGEYNGFGSGSLKFTCPNHCNCHD